MSVKKTTQAAASAAASEMTEAPVSQAVKPLAEPAPAAAPPAGQDAEIASEKPDGSCAAGFYCYIGPNIAETIAHGAVFVGTWAQALEAAKDAIEKNKLVKTLIVAGDTLHNDRLKVKTPGNALYANYKRIAEGK